VPEGLVPPRRGRAGASRPIREVGLGARPVFPPVGFPDRLPHPPCGSRRDAG
jgi:hypothetical protein